MAALVIDNVPASTFILALPVNEMVPLIELVPKIFLMAPVLVNPVPVIVMGSGIKSEPLISKAALLLTIVDDALVPAGELPKASLFCICKIPSVILVAPVYKLVAFKINLPVPVPSLVIAPAPEIAEETVTLPAPLTPKLNPPVLVIPPVLIVNKLAPSLLILDAVAVVIKPVNVLAPLVLGIQIAPLELIPVPFNVKGSAIVNPSPTIFTAAPALTMVFCAVVLPPKAAAFLTLMAPVLTVVTPV